MECTSALVNELLSIEFRSSFMHEPINDYIRRYYTHGNGENVRKLIDSFLSKLTEILKKIKEKEGVNEWIVSDWTILFTTIRNSLHFTSQRTRVASWNDFVKEDLTMVMKEMRKRIEEKINEWIQYFQNNLQTEELAIDFEDVKLQQQIMRQFYSELKTVLEDSVRCKATDVKNMLVIAYDLCLENYKKQKPSVAAASSSSASVPAASPVRNSLTMGMIIPGKNRKEHGLSAIKKRRR